MPSDLDLTRIVTDLNQLLDLIEPIPGGDSGEIGAARDGLARTIRNNLLYHVESSRRPLRVVFAGPTGSGKSTLLNSLVGKSICRSGSIRPTTATPLLLTAPVFADLFSDQDVDYEVVTGEAPILDELCLIDTPDIDSTNRDNHRLAARVVESADIVVYVTSALRYADLVPWELLRKLERRGIHVIHVVNRLSPAAPGAVTDFRRMLRREGMSGVVLRIEEHRVGSEERLQPASVRNLRRALLEAAGSRDDESEHLLQAGLADVAGRAGAMFDAIDRRDRGRDLVESTVRRGLIDFDAIDLTDQISRWRSLLRADDHARRVTRRWLARHGLTQDVCTSIEAEIRAELIAAVEAQLPLIEVEGEQVVLDLTRTPPRWQVALLDSSINAWLDDVPSTSGLHPHLFAYERASRALAGVDGVFGGDESSVSAVALRRQLVAVSAGIESRILTGLDLGSKVVDTAAGRAIVDRLTRLRTFADA
ncbi:MAG: 50S ribosome-binding GTPase [Acidimicrobiia bacterium]|nr:50S ribosome-binding GTPase [Acidimicrobiia bacterium]MDH3462771.1 50S ribosome-binding GTPase [Acidimicrobiia bacterium]